jgi:DNA modification methylase
MKAKLVPIKSIKTNPKNPRVIRDEKFQKLVKSIQEFPKMLDLRPIVVNKSMMVLGGNQRLKACIEAGLKEVPILIADELTKAEQERFIITDNVNFGDWDFSDLNANWNLESLENWGLDIDFGLDETKIEAKEDDYEIPEEIKTDIVIGDLFEIGNHRLLCGDSTDKEQVEKLMNGEKAGMVFTSPPYNTNNFNLTQSVKKKQYAKNIYNSKTMDKKTSEEYLNFNSDIFENILQIAGEKCNILYNISYNQNSSQEYIKIINSAIERGLKLQETIVWVKSAVIPQQIRLTRKTEFIFLLTNYKNDVPFSNQKKNETNYNLWEISNVGAQQKTHNACFPVELPSRGINLYCLSGEDIIFEPFCGAGTTMVASQQLNRKCYGMELDPKYCQVIIDRMLKLDPTLEIKKNGKKYVGIKKTK